MGFRVSFFVWLFSMAINILHACRKIVCYGEQKLHWAMDGGGSDCIEERFA